MSILSDISGWGRSSGVFERAVTRERMPVLAASFDMTAALERGSAYLYGAGSDGDVGRAVRGLSLTTPTFSLGGQSRLGGFQTAGLSRGLWSGGLPMFPISGGMWPGVLGAGGFLGAPMMGGRASAGGDYGGRAPGYTTPRRLMGQGHRAPAAAPSGTPSTPADAGAAGATPGAGAKGAATPGKAGGAAKAGPSAAVLAEQRWTKAAERLVTSVQKSKGLKDQIDVSFHVTARKITVTPKAGATLSAKPLAALVKALTKLVNGKGPLGKSSLVIGGQTYDGKMGVDALVKALMSAEGTKPVLATKTPVSPASPLVTKPPAVAPAPKSAPPAPELKPANPTPTAKSPAAPPPVPKPADPAPAPPAARPVPPPAAPSPKPTPTTGDPDTQLTLAVLEDNARFAAQVLNGPFDVGTFQVSWEFGPAKELVMAKIAAIKAQLGLSADAVVPPDKAEAVARALFEFAQAARPKEWPTDAATAAAMIAAKSPIGLGINFAGIQRDTKKIEAREFGNIVQTIDQPPEVGGKPNRGECSEQTALFLALNAAAKNPYVVGAEVFATRAGLADTINAKPSPTFHVCSVLRVPGKPDLLFDLGMKRIFSASANVHTKYAALSHQEFAALQAANLATIHIVRKRYDYARDLLVAAAALAPRRSFIPYVASSLETGRITQKEGETDAQLFTRYEQKIAPRLRAIDRALALTGLEGVQGRRLPNPKIARMLDTTVARDQQLVARKIAIIKDLIAGARKLQLPARQRHWQAQLDAFIGQINPPSV